MHNSLTKYNRDSFLSPIDQLLDEAMNSMFGVSSFNKASFPKVDVLEYDDRFVLEADVAGLAKEDVSVDLEGDVLTIRGGKRQQSETDKNARYVYREIKRSNFVRSFVVGDIVDKANIKADFQNGSLKVTLPRAKAEDQKPQRIKLL